MRVALVRAHDDVENTRQLKAILRRAGCLPHLGLGYIHTALTQAGHEVKTIDVQAFGLTDEQLREVLARFAPALVGVTTTTPSLPGALVACRIAKEIGATVILGGPHTEVFAAENLYHPFIDYVGAGEGATLMVQLANALDAGEDPTGIPGVVSRDVHPGLAPMLRLQEIGWPNRDSVPMGLYHSIMAKNPFATMISSRGCPFQCSFCFKQSVDKRKSVFRDAEDVVAEMRELVERWGVREIMFYDDVFTMKRDRVYQICEEIRRLGLKVRWEAPTRVDLVDEKLLRAMAGAGCIRLRFGIESGDPDILVRMKKESDLGVIESSVNAAHKAGIQAFAYFIVGYLNETWEQYERTVELACRLPLAYASFYTATPLPGTTLHTEAVAAGAIPADYWLRFVRGETVERVNFLVPDAEERARLAYRRFYLRRRKIGTILNHMVTPRMAWSVASGLASLMRSESNQVRDI